MPNGCSYEGDVDNDKPYGKGKFIWPNGIIFQGEWKNGLMHGKGSIY